MMAGTGRARGNEDLEMGEREDDVFITGSNRYFSKNYDRPSILTRWMPPRLKSLVESLSRIKLMLALLALFLLLLAYLGWAGNLPILSFMSVPSESLAMRKDLKKTLKETDLPPFVFKYAPLVVLDKGEKYFPSDMQLHVSAAHPMQNSTEVKGAPEPLTLKNLNLLNKFGDKDVFLSSKENLIKYPKFLEGERPDEDTLQTTNATNAVIISVDKGNGTVDAFYMYFYSFNQGPTALRHTVGNHMGDWEHNMIRFKDGKPQAVWFSQHEFGEAFTYKAVQKVGKRPLAFSARGSHANYAEAGKHDLHDQEQDIPKRIVYDHTSEGDLWDPSLSAYYYTYDLAAKKLNPVLDDTPTEYLDFKGRWGDAQFGDKVAGQENLYGFRKWTSGPQGPMFKDLGRKSVCLSKRPICIVREKL